MALPPPQEAGPFRVALVCLGNICRSPIADVVVNERLAEAGLSDHVHVDSYGTGPWHVGKSMDPRSATVLEEQGYDPTRHRARQIDAATAAAYDLVVAMDRANAADLRALGVPEDRLRLLRDFDDDPGDREIPDPYHDDDGFAEVLAMVERSARGLSRALAEEVTHA